MYLGVGETHTLISEIAAAYHDWTGLAVFPSLELTSSVAHATDGTDILLGAQDCFWERSGAFTGGISPENLKAIGCHYVLIGHSERRAMGETDEIFRKKFAAALAAGLTPVLCVGETQQQRDAGEAHASVKHQLSIATNGITVHDYLVAYEPVWAIGTGRAATPDDAAEMCTYIKSIAGDAMTLYGGSVDAGNIAGFAAQDTIDGFLVGSASTSTEKLFPLLDALHT